MVFAFLFKLSFGLSLPFWPPDQLQTYLIGLKCYTTGTWPYFGPDIGGVGNAFFQIPGALEGLVIGLPFYLFPYPETPFIVLNLLSLAAILLLTWYCSKRVPALSLGFIFFSLMFLPWPLQYNSGMINGAYCLFGSSLFFVGFFESLPGFRIGVLSPRWGNALMGFGTFWVMQFHASWIYLAFFFGLSLWLQFKSDRASGARALGFFALGALPPFALIVPTLLKYGIPAEHAGGFASGFYLKNFKLFLTILARYFSLASFEMPVWLDSPGCPGFIGWGAAAGPHWNAPSFVGPSTYTRIGFLLNSPLLLVTGLFLWIVGLAQPIAMLVIWFFKKHALKDWERVRWLVLANFMMVWVSFWFTPKEPLSHIYYNACFPMVFLYSLYCWSRLAESGKWKNFAKVYLIAAFLFQSAYAVNVVRAYSLYTNRGLLVKAIDEKNYHLVGERRPLSYY